MLVFALMPFLVAAAGWALMGTLLTGGGIGTFILLFFVFKMLGK